jgi:hypothetical protein
MQMARFDEIVDTLAPPVLWQSDPQGLHPRRRLHSFQSVVATTVLRGLVIHLAMELQGNAFFCDVQNGLRAAFMSLPLIFLFLPRI